MSRRTDGSAMDAAWHEFTVLWADFQRDATDWLAVRSDLERLMGLCIFILLLFLLMVARGRSRERKPGPGRSFAGAVTLVMVFSFCAGWLIDSRFDWPHIL